MRSQEEITYLAARWLHRQHGDWITVAFHEMASPETEREFPAVVGTIKTKRLPLPVVEIGGQLTPLPFLSYWAIVDIVEGALSEQEQPA